MTPGTHPQSVRMKTITKDPHPLSITANGGKRIESRTRQILINLINCWFYIFDLKNTKSLHKT